MSTSSNEMQPGAPSIRALDAAAAQTSARPRGWLALGVALLILNFALTFHNVWPTPWVTSRHELSIEIAALLLLLAGYSGRRGPPSRAAFVWMAVVVTLLAIGRYAEVTAPALFGRRINIYWDGQHLPAVAAMLTETVAPWLLAAWVLGFLALLGGTFWIIRWSLLCVRDNLRVTARRRAIAAVATVLVTLFAIGHAGNPLGTLGWFSLPVTMTYARQVQFVVDAMTESRHGERLPPAAAAGAFAASDLGGLGGADVFVIFLESYGATTYDEPAIAGRLAGSRRRLGEAIAASGNDVVSAFVESPTFGGASWLAHMSLMTGTPVTDGSIYELMLTQDRMTLSRHFKSRGYRSLALMPGLRNPWPEGAFYAHDAILGAAELGYTGPEFGWWRIPDQYALAKLEELELGRPSRAPLFVLFSTITSHVPFHPVPPYQPDWARLRGPAPYDPGALEQARDQAPEWTNLQPAYARTVDYALTYIAGFLPRVSSDDSVIVVIGDHQPLAGVTGEGARWDVPVHVITGRRAVLGALRSGGFSAGLTPAAAPIGGMHELTALLLGAFDAG